MDAIMVGPIKRGVNDIHEYYELAAIVDIVMKAKPLPYIYEPWKQDRDRALLALLACTGMRISEALSVQVKQFSFEMPDFVEIRNVRILKRRAEPIYKDFFLPLEGILYPLTNMVVAYTKINKEGYLFDFSRSRAWQIINYMTGKWCHFFRSQRLSYLVNKLRSTIVVADMQGIKSPQTVAHYFKGGWKHYKDELKE